MRRLPSFLLLSLAGMVAACASSTSETSSAPDGKASDGGTGPQVASFAAQLCTGSICWIAPALQGNLLWKSAVTPTGTTYAVGENGTFLRFDGTWKATAITRSTGEPPELGYPQLRALAAIADDDVWIAGDSRALFHFDGKTISEVSVSLDGRFDFIGLWASSKDDVWLAAKQGSVLHFDGSTWSESHAGDREIVSFSALSSDDDVHPFDGRQFAGLSNSTPAPLRRHRLDGMAVEGRHRIRTLGSVRRRLCRSRAALDLWRERRLPW